MVQRYRLLTALRAWKATCTTLRSRIAYSVVFGFMLTWIQSHLTDPLNSIRWGTWLISAILASVGTFIVFFLWEWFITAPRKLWEDAQRDFLATNPAYREYENLSIILGLIGEARISIVTHPDATKQAGKWDEVVKNVLRDWNTEYLRTYQQHTVNADIEGKAKFLEQLIENVSFELRKKTWGDYLPKWD